MDLFVDVHDRSRAHLEKVIRVESVSSPPGGEVKVFPQETDTDILVSMVSEDLSTSRAMLNSYLGLLSAAMDVLQDR